MSVKPTTVMRVPAPLKHRAHRGHSKGAQNEEHPKSGFDVLNDCCAGEHHLAMLNRSGIPASPAAQAVRPARRAPRSEASTSAFYELDVLVRLCQAMAWTPQELAGELAGTARRPAEKDPAAACVMFDLAAQVYDHVLHPDRPDWDNVTVR